MAGSRILGIIMSRKDILHYAYIIAVMMERLDYSYAGRMNNGVAERTQLGTTV